MLKVKSFFVSAGAVVVALACGSVDDAATPRGEDTTPRIGEAQSALAGSCVGVCGRQSGTCWCDTYCTQYGDCCSDYVAQCTNDQCTKAKVLQYAPFETSQFTTYAKKASTDPGLTCASGTGNPIQAENTVWFKFTTTHAGTIVIDATGTNYGVNIGVHTGSCGNFTQVACGLMLAEDKSFRFEAQANKTYYVQVGDWYGDGGGGGTLKFRLDQFRWTFKATPQGSRPFKIVVDPTNDSVWYVGTTDGVYVTRDAGSTWNHYFAGTLGWGIAADPSKPGIVYVGADNVLFVGANSGASWAPIQYFPAGLLIYSIHVSSSGEVYVGHHWGGRSDSPGIYKASAGGNPFNFFPFNIPAIPGGQDKGLILWDIAQDPQNGYLYVGAEPASKPSGITYDPPTLRSKDGGQTWQDISGQHGASGSLDHHATSIQVGESHKVYFQMEGGELEVSTNNGDTSQPRANNVAWDMILDPNNLTKIFSGNVSSATISLSTDDGFHFRPIGPPDGGDSGMLHFAFNKSGGTLYAAREASSRPGVYVIGAGDNFSF